MTKFLTYNLCILIAICLLLFNSVLAGEIQQRYENAHYFKINNVAHSLADDYKAYTGNGGSIYGVISYYLDVYPKNSNNYKYLNKVKANYDSHFMDTTKWEYIDTPNSEYIGLSDVVKNILIFNNNIYRDK